MQQHDPYTYKGMARAAANKDVEALSEYLSQPGFDTFVEEAYDAKEGYSIRINPLTGEKEMMVAGSRNMGDWAMNAIDSFDQAIDDNRKFLYKTLPGGKVPENMERITGAHPSKKGTYHYALTRGRYEQRLAQIAEENGVTVVYGHSRGGGIIADTDFGEGVTKVGLDSAMVIAENKEMLNLYEGGEGKDTYLDYFDEGIGMTGTNNLHLNLGGNVHHVWD